MLTQKTVDLSSSKSWRRWIEAVPKALSVNAMAKPEKAITIAARPQSNGVSRRASTSATAMRVIWSVTCDPAFQAMPLRTRAPIESGVTRFGRHACAAFDAIAQRDRPKVGGECARRRYERCRASFGRALREPAGSSAHRDQVRPERGGSPTGPGGRRRPRANAFRRGTTIGRLPFASETITEPTPACVTTTRA